jgi:hypothetical protein
MQNMHMDPEETVQAGRDVEARAMVPMHWSTFWLSREPVLEPIERTRSAWTVAGRRRADLWDLAVGGVGRSKCPPSPSSTAAASSVDTFHRPRASSVCRALIVVRSGPSAPYAFVLSINYYAA